MTGTVDLEDLAGRCHRDCFVCRSPERGGLGLRFRLKPDGAVRSHFDCDPRYQGYPDRLHGGVVAMLLDSAMTHWLFAHGVQGLTASLSVRYHKPVSVGVRATVEATLFRVRRRLHELRATLVQDGVVRASGRALFLPPAAPIEPGGR